MPYKCPKNQNEVDVASLRLGCGKDLYENNQYMCLPNMEKTALVEFCFDGVMGIQSKGMQRILFSFSLLSIQKIESNVKIYILC